MDKLNLPSTNSLKERGYYFLSIGEYKEAALYFNRALDIDITIVDCYLGLLLSDYQCSSVADLVIKYAVDFEDNINFISALRFADEKGRNDCKALLFVASMFCHIKVFENLENADYFVLEKRIKCYEAFSCKDERISLVHSFLRDNYYSDEIIHLIAKAYLYLYEIYDSLPYIKSLSLTNDSRMVADGLKDIIKAGYKAIMEFHLKEILKPDTDSLKEKIDLWCNPAKVSAEGIDLDSSTPIGLDGNSDIVSERYLYLAKELEKSRENLTVTDFDLISYCYENAEEKSKSEAEKQKALSKKAAFFERVSDIKKSRNKENMTGVLEALIEKEPQNPDFQFSCVLNLTDFLSAKPLAFVRSEECSSLLTKTCEEYNEEEVNAVLKELYGVKEELEAEYASAYEDAKAFAEKAFFLSQNKKQNEYKEKWEKYEASYSSLYNESYANVNATIEEVISFNEKTVAQGKKEADKKGNRYILSAALLSVILNAVPAAFAAYAYLKPKELISLPLLYIYLGALGVAVIFGIITRSFAKKISKKQSGFFSWKKSKSILLKASTSLASLASLGVMALVILSFIALPSQLGTVKIKNAKQFRYIENCPHASFVLSDDINLKKNSKISLLVFAGKIDGKGHTVSGLKVSEKSFLKYNFGTIKNLTLKNMNVSPFCENNYGKLTSLTFEDSKFTSSIVAHNSKTVKNITVKNSSFDFASRTKLREAVVKASSVPVKTDSFNLYNCRYKGISMYVSALAGLYLREGPDKYSSPIEIMPQYTTVIVEKVQDGWCYVNKNGTYGWCSAEYLSYEV